MFAGLANDGQGSGGSAATAALHPRFPRLSHSIAKASAICVWGAACCCGGAWWCSGSARRWCSAATLLAGHPAAPERHALRQPWGHYQPPWYFRQVLPADFLPWSLLVPAAVIGGRALDRERRRHLLFLGCWVVATVLFFSVSPGKRTVYVLTCYPALALFTGAGLAALSRRAPGERSRIGRLAWPVAGFAVLLWIIALAAPHATRWVEVPAFAAPLLAPTAIGIGVLAAAATVAFVLAWRGRVVPMVAALALGLALTTLPLFVWLLPKLDSELSLRSLAGLIATDLPSGYTLASYHEMEGGLLFYGAPFAREVGDDEELRSLLAEPNGVWLVVDPDDRGGLTWPLDLPVVARQNESEDSVRIFASRPDCRAMTFLLAPVRAEPASPRMRWEPWSW